MKPLTQNQHNKLFACNLTYVGGVVRMELLQVLERLLGKLIRALLDQLFQRLFLLLTVRSFLLSSTLKVFSRSSLLTCLSSRAYSRAGTDVRTILA
jgi:hypothetical protein